MRTSRRRAAASRPGCRCPCRARAGQGRHRCRRAVSEIRPPGSVNLMALLSKFQRICSRRVGSASTRTGCSGSETTRSYFRSPAEGLTVCTTRVTIGASSTTSLRSSIRPRLMRSTSMRSSTSRARCVTSRSAIAALGLVIRSARSGHQLEARCGSAPAGCAARERGWPGTRPCGGRLASSSRRAGHSRRRPPPGSPGPVPAGDLPDRSAVPTPTR